MDGETCATCRFWDTGIGIPPRHLCRRRSPGVVSGQLIPEQHSLSSDPAVSYHGVWPTTADDDWCGEHKPKRVPLPVAGDKSLPLEEWTPAMLADELALLVRGEHWQTARTFARLLRAALARHGLKLKGDA